MESAGRSRAGGGIPVVFLVGPTAVGKTSVGIELAVRLGGEIVSADSMQVYRGLDIISAKPGADERRLVRHHLIDILDPSERCDVALYILLAREAIADIDSRGRVPIVVGGSGMYVRALIDGIFEGAGRDDGIRARLKKEAEERGIGVLYSRLEKVDPPAANRINPADRRRIIRALEVFESTGLPLSALQRQWEGEAGEMARAGLFFSRNLGRRVVMFGLRRGRDDLRRRIGERVETMFERGAVEEVRRLLRISGEGRNTILQALGLKEIRRCIEGKSTLAEAKAELKKNSRAVAKRQLTWFGRDQRIVWIDIVRDEGAKKTAERINSILVRLIH